MAVEDGTEPKPLMTSMEGLDPLVKDPKATEDFSKDADELIPKAVSLGKSGRIGEAVEELLTLEKRARFAYDGLTVSRILQAIAKMYYDAKDMNGLLDIIPLLVKRRGQLKRPICDLVQLCMGWLKGMEPRELKYRMIDCLAKVTEGKIFVEVERARIKRLESQMKEEEGNVEEAALILQEEQVEVCGAMERLEKTDYILDQMRLVLLRKDFIRLPIIGKKLNAKLFDTEKELFDLKLKFYEYYIYYYLHEDNLAEVSICYTHILNTPSIRANNAKAVEVLGDAALYMCLAPRDEKSKVALSSMISKEKRLFDEIPVIRDLVTALLSGDLMRSPMKNEDKIKSCRVFQDIPYPGGKARFETLKKRIVQHNILNVISQCYTRIRMERVSEILGLSPKATEAELTELVSNKSLSAKIDRPAGIIRFGARLPPQERLDQWTTNLNKVLDLVEGTSSLVQKELMVSATKQKIRDTIAKEQQQQ